MRVLMVSDHGCIRVVKEAIALIQAGVTVDLATNAAPFGWNYFNTCSMWWDADQLKRTVASSQADIIHVHNEPDWIVKACRDATSKPVVYDIHDLESLRWQKPPDKHEQDAVKSANAVIHVSEYTRLAYEYYHKDAGLPEIVLPSYTNAIFFAPPLAVNWAAFVYEGGLSTDPMIKDEENKYQNFRSLQGIVQAITSQGYAMHLYPAVTPPNSIIYENLGAIVSAPQNYPTLIRALSTYGFGFVGGPQQSALMDCAMPNKLFEYLAAGIVPVVYNALAAGRWVTEHQMGIHVEDLSDLPHKLMSAPLIRENILRLRSTLTMEGQISKLVELYEAIL
jgi:glycosyltransferase involved in cell wall biosynthesis